MPEFVIRRVSDALNEDGKAVKGSRVLVLGLAYKPNVDDERESPSYALMSLLSERGAQVEYYDPYVPVIRPTREHPQWAAVISQFDLVLIATNHACVKLSGAARLGAAHRRYEKRNELRTRRARSGVQSVEIRADMGCAVEARSGVGMSRVR